MGFADVEFDVDTCSEVTLVNERHCRRSIGAYKFSEFSGARSAIDAGSQLQELSLTVRHPESMLCDLSNLDWPMAQWPKFAIEQAFVAIEDALQTKPRPSPIRRITGEDLKPELAVSGPSLHLLAKWRTEFLTDVLARFGSVGSEVPRGLQKTYALIDTAELVQRTVREFALFYSQFIHPAYWGEHPALNLQRLYCDHPVWTALAALPGRKLFVLTAGLSLGISYMSWTGDNDIYFTEHHRQNDANQLSRLSPFTGIFPEPPAVLDWVVIDKSYSGGTIEAAADRLRSHLRIPINIIKVALFPKSLQAIRRSDYFVYAGRLFCCADILPRLSSGEWHLELLRAT